MCYRHDHWRVELTFCFWGDVAEENSCLLCVNVSISSLCPCLDSEGLCWVLHGSPSSQVSPSIWNSSTCSESYFIYQLFLYLNCTVFIVNRLDHAVSICCYGSTNAQCWTTCTSPLPSWCKSSLIFTTYWPIFLFVQSHQEWVPKELQGELIVLISASGTRWQTVSHDNIGLIPYLVTLIWFRFFFLTDDIPMSLNISSTCYHLFPLQLQYIILGEQKCENEIIFKLLTTEEKWCSLDLIFQMINVHF